MQKGFSEDAMTRENRKQFREDIETYVRRHGELVLLLLALLMGAAGTCLYGIYAGTGACPCGADSLVGRPVPGVLYAWGWG